MRTTGRNPRRMALALCLTILAGAVVAPADASAAALMRGPYLQLPTTSGMLLRWRTDVPTDSRVQIGAIPGAPTQTVDDATLTTEHAVALGGLTPDTVYYYSIGSTTETLAGNDAAHFFRTSPPPGPAQPMRIWVTGDGGFANANGLAVRDAYAAYNAGNATDFWLLLGDNAYFVGSDADFQAAFFDMHRDMLRSVPAWPTFGNHEALSSSSLTQTGPYFDIFTLPTAAQAGGVPSGTEAYYAFDYANVHFIVLDSQSNANTPGSPMMLWLEADLQSTTADWVIAFWHHPPYSKGLLHDSDLEVREINMRTNVLPLLDDYGVDLVLCGHSHSYERSYLLDGHYGFSSSFGPQFQVDSGDGDPLGDGPYRKSTIGPAPHEGAVYVVAGSSSEVRPATLNHPALRVGLLELGSLVLDVDGNALTATFLNNLVQTTDVFRIVKGSPCPAAPQPACQASAKGRISIRNNADPSRDSLSWRWSNGVLDSAQVGAPESQTDLAVCLYDQDGVLLGGSVAPGTPRWKRNSSGAVVYNDVTAADAGVRRMRIRPGSGVKATFRVAGKGAALAVPTLAVTTPVRAQLVNLDNGACWQTVFPTATRSTPDLFLAAIP